MSKIIIGVMGPGATATPLDLTYAYDLGQLIAQAGWVLLTGGRKLGVMHAASQGAKAAGGLTLGIMPTADRAMLSEAVDLPIFTDMGNARNNINVLSSQVVIACGMGTGTASEVALALKANKPVILVNSSRESQAFFQQLAPAHVGVAATPAAAIHQVMVHLRQVG